MAISQASTEPLKVTLNEYVVTADTRCGDIEYIAFNKEITTGINTDPFEIGAAGLEGSVLTI